MNATEDRSPNGAPGAQGSVTFRTTSASPVKLDSSMSKSTAVSNRTSAGTRSPTVKETISPGNRLFAKTVFWWESLQKGVFHQRLLTFWRCHVFLTGASDNGVAQVC